MLRSLRFILFAGLILNCVPLFVEGSDLPDSIPEPVVPVYEKLKDLHLITQLVDGSQPEICIVAPDPYSSQGKAIQVVIKQITGVVVPLLTAGSLQPASCLKSNLILLGNRSTNRMISGLYDRGFTFLDLKYPGSGGYVVRSLHNPFGDGHNVLFAGGSDLDGVKASAIALIDILKSAGGKPGTLFVNYISEIRLSREYQVPDSAPNAEIWEASGYYGSAGYFGWNTISKCMALFYMTGRKCYADEFLRLAFPDRKTVQEIEQTDAELIEDKKDPLAGPYHYGSHMMIVLWDIIEESPVFSNEQRLKITNAFARQLLHRVAEYGSIYRNNMPPAYLGDRHYDWAALSLYSLGSYFKKDYPDPVWKRCVKAADIYFSALATTSWIAGNNDHLFWFTSYYDPMMDYLIFTGNRDSAVLKNLSSMLNTQEILCTGSTDDWGLKASSLSMLNKAAYILHDGSWLYFREHMNLNTDIFRLGQSFWPGPELTAVLPAGFVRNWKIEWMQNAMWKSRDMTTPPEQSFRWGSYRSEAGSGGDYLLLKGYNGGGRNPYHSFDILELRLHGETILKGYHNQLLTSIDGLVEPRVALNAALLYHGVTGNCVSAVGETAGLPFADWRRTVMLQTGKYALIADDLTFRKDADNLSVEISWEMPEAVGIPDCKCVRINELKTQSAVLLEKAELHSSGIMTVKAGAVSKMGWQGKAIKGRHKIFFHLLSHRYTGKKGDLACLKMSDNVAALALPEAAIVIAGRYGQIESDLLILSEDGLSGHAVRHAGLSGLLFSADSPVELDWDFRTGLMNLRTGRPVVINLALPEITINGRQVHGKADHDLFRFKLESGKQLITGAKPSLATLATLKKQLRSVLLHARRSLAKAPTRGRAHEKAADTELIPVFRASIGDNTPDSVFLPSAIKSPEDWQFLLNRVTGIIIPSAAGNLFCTAAKNMITVFDQEGKAVRKLRATADVRVLRWWAEPKLLLAGCADEQVIAFDEKGARKWSYTSQMAPEVYETGKRYWFKSAYPGISGLYSGSFDAGKSRAFVGSACTLEILNEDGRLVRRLPLFWSVIRQFLIVDATNGGKDLLVGGWPNGANDLTTFNSKSIAETGRGFDRVPAGQSLVNGFMTMNRYDNFLIDLNGDSKKEVVSAINGNWNRITIYNQQGEPLYNQQVGPGVSTPRANLRMMDVGDIDHDGKPEIIAGLSSGFIVAFDGKLKKRWAKKLSSPPVVIKIVKSSFGSWICAGCENGTVLAMDERGRIIGQGKISGRPVDLEVMDGPVASLAVMTSDSGELIGFKHSVK